jgi:hypothetical protein
MKILVRLTLCVAILVAAMPALPQTEELGTRGSHQNKSDGKVNLAPLRIGATPTVIKGAGGTLFINLTIVNSGQFALSNVTVTRISLTDSVLRAPKPLPIIIGSIVASGSSHLQASFQTKENDDSEERKKGRVIVSGTFDVVGKIKHFVLSEKISIPPNPKFSLAINGTDPLIVGVRSSKGEMIEYFGEKTGGIVTTFSSVAVKHIDGTVTRYSVDSQGKPIDAESPDGSTAHFTWVTDTSGVATFISPNGAEHLSIAFDLNKTNSAGAAKVAANSVGTSPRFRGTFLPPHTGAECSSPAQKKLSAATGALIAAAAVACGENSVCTQVTHCGPEDNAAVRVHVSSATQTYDLPASLLAPSTGIYASSVPTPNNVLTNIPSLCNSAASVLSKACIAVPILAALCAEVSLRALAAPVFLGCLDLFLGSQVVCAILGGTGGPPGGPSPAEQLCTNVQTLIDRAQNAPIKLEPIAELPGAGTLLGTVVQTSPNPPFPLLNVAFPQVTLVQSFTTDPVDPPATVGYVATASISCAPLGTIINLSISGTDGFTESTSCTIQGNGSCTMLVPGAAVPGIVDTLIAQVVGGPSATAINVFQ